MNSRSKLIEQLENKLMENYPKEIADNLLTNYSKLIELIEPDFRISLKYSTNLKLIIKHKSFAQSFECYFKKGNLILNNKKINPNNINEILYQLLDKII